MLTVSFFAGATDNDPKELELDWPGFVELLRKWSDERAETDCHPCQGKTCAAKVAGPAFSPANYDGARGKDNAREVHLFAGDLDHLTREQVADVRARLAGLAHVLYSTHNHLRGGDDDWSLRVVLPLTRPVATADWRRFWLTFAEASGLPLDRVVKSSAQLLFLPSRPRGHAHVFEVGEGLPVDVDLVLAHAPPPVIDTVPTLGPNPATPQEITVIDAEARELLVLQGKLARTLAPHGAYGREGLGRRMTLYNTGRLIGGLAAAGRVPLEDALGLVERLVEPPLTPGGECEKALRDGARVGAEAPIPLSPGAALLDDALGRPSTRREYPIEPWTWSQLESVCRGAPDDARPRELVTLPPAAPGEAPVVAEATPVNVALVRDRIDRRTLLRLLRRTERSDEVVNCGGNVTLLVRHLLHGHVRFDMLSKEVKCTDQRFARETPDTLPKAIADWLTFEDEVEVAASAAMVADALLLVGTENAYNPLEEYLRGLAWDGTARIDAWLETYARAVVTDDAGRDVRPYVRTVGPRWLIAAAARALYPGCKVDTALVLESPEQGLGKSTVLDVLGGEWFSDTPLAIGQKDANQAAGSAWIIELAELASLRKAESESQKAFLSSRTDYFRLPYGRAVQRFKRACVFGGTTNAEHYLHDPTGNRRFWCVRVAGEADIDGLRRDRDQLWAEAVHRLHHASRPDLCRGPKHPQGPGERWWFTRAEQAVADAIAATRTGDDRSDSVVARVHAYLSNLPPAALDRGVTTGDVAKDALEVPVERHNRSILTEVGAALRSWGLVPRGEHRPRRYFRR